MKTLLKTIRENDKELDGLLQSIISYAVNKSDELGTQKNYVKTKITQSRIKELESLVESIPSGAVGRACDFTKDTIVIAKKGLDEILHDTINKLKN